MTADRLMVLDLLASVAAAAAWLGAGATAAARRPRAAAALFVAAVLASLTRIWSVVALAGAGWWFVQEKVTLALPLLLIASVAATALAGPRLVAAVRTRAAAPTAAPVVVVPLLAAGYAAVAGPVHALLLGYPATWSTGLVVTAVVAFAVLVTWRVIAAAPVPGLRVAVAAVTATALVGVGLAVVPPTETTTTGDAAPAGSTALMAQHRTAQDTGHGVGHDTGQGRPVDGFRGPDTPAPGGAIRRFELTARTATITLASGKRVEAWTFDGQVPGPAITAAQGDLIEVRLRNADVSYGVTLHWHGYDVPAGEDGVPGLTQDAVMPGQEFTYRFRADQAGTYWYHTHEVSDEGVRKGLYGTLVVAPRSAAPAAPEDVDLALPVHTFTGTVVFGDQDRPIVRQAPPGTSVRLRLINTDNTPHRFTLSGVPYRLVAVDGDDLHEPGELARVGLRLPAGGRYDLAFTMPATGAVVLRADDRVVGVRLTPVDGAAGDGEDTSGWPELDLLGYGTPAPTAFTAAGPFDRRFTLVLDRGVSLAGGRPMYAHTVNGHAFPDIPTQLVADGDLIKLTVVNRGLETHPWHLHGHRVLVLSRDGRAPTGTPLWLDTFDVRPGEVWEVAFRAANPGLWMNHCHNLSHADMGMMLHLAYEGVTTPFHGAHSG